MAGQNTGQAPGQGGGSSSRRQTSAVGGLKGRIAAAALGLFVVVVAGIVALFALYYANLQHQRSTENLRALEQARSIATEAQVAFKLQVQEWKNVLLRGGDEQDYDQYRAAMAARGEDLREALASITRADGEDEENRARVARLLEDHEQVEARYREALVLFEASGRSDPWAADALVRGVDRPIDAELDRLAAHFGARADAALAAGQAESQQRYDTLRRTVLIANGLGLLLLLVPLLGSLRSSRR